MFRVLAFTLEPVENAVTRYRVLQFCELAHRDGIHIEHRSLLDGKFYERKVRGTHLFRRVLAFPLLLAARVWQVLFLAPRYDAIWISREMVQIGPPILERILLRCCKRVVLDIDDAMHFLDESSPLISRLLRDRGKFARTAASYAAIICGNEYLADYYRKHSTRVSVIPTVVDVKRYAEVRPGPSVVVRIGWVGTPYNRHNLDLVRVALTQLAKERKFELVTVGLNQALDWDIHAIRHINWKRENELAYFSLFDIGIMPLKDSDFARGKCAFKLIQYMAGGLPVVASAVGANCDVIQHGRIGFLVNTDEEWRASLRLLIDDAALRLRMGEQGRQVAEQLYSTQSAWPQYAELLTGISRTSHVCTA